MIFIKNNVDKNGEKFVDVYFKVDDEKSSTIGE
jgi:hypothetical protein